MLFLLDGGSTKGKRIIFGWTVLGWLSLVVTIQIDYQFVEVTIQIDYHFVD